MNRLKDNYQFIIGFVAIIISLSAFKDKLATIKIDLSFHEFNASDLFFWLIICYIIVLQLYIIPYVLTIKFPSSKLLKITGNALYTSFLILSVSPIILGIISLTVWLVGMIPPISESTMEYISAVITIVIGFISIWISSRIVQRFKKEKIKNMVEKLAEEEVKEFETANRLIKDGYYSQSIFELFKLIETKIYKVLLSKGVELKRRNIIELLAESKRNNILNRTDIDSINELRDLRNKVAHKSDIIISKEEAIRLQKIVKSKMDLLNEYERELESSSSQE